MKTSKSALDFFDDPTEALSMLIVLKHFLNEDCNIDAEEYDDIDTQRSLLSLIKRDLIFIASNQRILLTPLGEKVCAQLNSQLL